MTLLFLYNAEVKYALQLILRHLSSKIQYGCVTRKSRIITQYLQIMSLADKMTLLPCVFFDGILGFPCTVFGVCVCVGITVRLEGQGGQAEEERPQQCGEHCMRERERAPVYSLHLNLQRINTV